MTTLSVVNLRLNGQNIDMGAAGMSRDYDDCNRFYQRLEVQNPFNIEDAHLHSLSTGVVSVAGKDPADCEIAELEFKKLLITTHSMRLRLNGRRKFLLWII